MCYQKVITESHRSIGPISHLLRQFKFMTRNNLNEYLCRLYRIVSCMHYTHLFCIQTLSKIQLGAGEIQAPPQSNFESEIIPISENSYQPPPAPLLYSEFKG